MVQVETVSNTELLVSWAPPAYAGGQPVSKYKVEWDPQPTFDSDVDYDVSLGKATVFSSESAPQTDVQTIAVAVSPGNYLEYQALRQSVAPPSGTQAGVPGAARRVCYGCTDVVSATDFLKQLGELAAKGGAA